jgi:hypothetical protein
MELSAKDFDIFGLMYFGGGATVKKMSLINVLAAGAHLPVAVLGINHCSRHMAEGGKKQMRVTLCHYFIHTWTK